MKTKNGTILTVAIIMMAWSAMNATTLADDAVFVMDSLGGTFGSEAEARAVEAQRPVTVRGVAQLPDGMPAERAVIVSSAGGQAVSNADGSFTLEVEMPSDADSIGLTAVATINGVNLAANRIVAIDRGSNARDMHSVTLHLSDDCEPAWVPTFGGLPGIDDGTVVYALTAFDDGSGDGPTLYAGGFFTSAGGGEATNIAKWDGTAWSPLGTGINGLVRALTVFDDGSGGGPALYAGGSFTTAGGVSAFRIAKWDGSSWSALGSEVSGGGVLALAVFDDGSGSGPALYAGGTFTTAGGVEANRIAKWNGEEWSPLGLGTSSTVSALAVFDDGSSGGPALYVSGQFTTAGGVEVNHIARWDGSSWSALGTGMDNTVRALTVFDDGFGGGPALYAGGSFTTAGGVEVNGIAKWDGNEWSPLGTGTGGDFLVVSALTVFDDGFGGGPALYAGGTFTTAGGVEVNRIAKWDGNEWSRLGMTGMNNTVRALTVFDDGSGDGPALYAGGTFTSAGGVEVNYIAKWDGNEWSPLGKGIVAGHLFGVLALTVFDDGSGGGPALYAGGQFNTAGGVEVNSIAKWDGSSWSALGTGMSSGVLALTVFDDGSGDGPALYAGGAFTTAGGVQVNRIAKWDGEQWSALSTGMNDWVWALTVLDDGSGGGPALYAGGDLTSAGGVAASRIAKWNGEEWSALGTGMNFRVLALTGFDDGSGSGPALYAGGSFTTAGGVEAIRIAKWDGSSWSALGTGMGGLGVVSLTVFDDGSGDGPALYAGGSFTTAGGVAANDIAKWDGDEWSPLSTGMSGPSSQDGVFALTAFDDGSPDGRALFAGGSFTRSPAGDSYLAEWQGCPIDPKCPVFADLNCDGVVDVDDLFILLAAWGACDAPDDCPADLDGNDVVDIDDLFILLANWS